MPENQITAKVIDEIAEIMRRVGKREEIESEIAENISFSELITELLGQEGPVRDAAARAIVAYIKGMEIDCDSDIASNIMEAIDVKEIMPALVKDDSFQKTLTDAIEAMFENGDIDLSEQISECLTTEEIAKALNTPTMKEALAEKVKEYFDGIDLSDLESFNETFDEIAFSKENIEDCLKANADALNEKIMEAVESYFENMNEDSDGPIATAISESKAFQTAINKALDNLIDSDKITRLVEKTAAEMLAGGNSEFRSQLTEAISTQMVNKIAASVVDRIFTR